jgi:hypothetical protein
MVPLRLWLPALALLGACRGEATPDPEPVPAPRAGLAAASGATRDFGEVWEGLVLEHDFALTAHAPLAVSAVNRSCGCTRAELWWEGGGERRPYVYGDRLEAGDSLVLEAAFETLGRPGTQHKTLDVLGDWPGGRLTLALDAVVVSYLTASPPEVGVPDSIAGQSRSGRAELRAADGRTFSARVDRTGLPPGLALDLRPLAVDADGRSPVWELLLDVEPELAVGSYRWPIRIATDLTAEGFAPGGPGSRPDCLQGVVRFEHHRRARLEAQPRHVSLGLLDAGQLSGQAVRVLALAEDASLDQPQVTLEVALTDGSDLSEHFRAEFDPKGLAGEPALQVTCLGLPEGRSGAFRGAVRLGFGRDDDGASVEHLVVGLSGSASGR